MYRTLLSCLHTVRALGEISPEMLRAGVFTLIFSELSNAQLFRQPNENHKLKCLIHESITAFSVSLTINPNPDNLYLKMPLHYTGHILRH